MEGDAGNANGSSAHKIQRRGNSIVQHHRETQTLIQITNEHKKKQKRESN